MCKINPRVDFAFKKLFGSEENKDILIDFINSIVSVKDKVTDLELKNPYNSKNFKNDRLSILDIKAQDTAGKWFNVEMQIMDQDYYAQRALYYWARLYHGQLASGINYDSLRKTIGINILNFNCLEEIEYHNTFKLLNVLTGKEFLDHIEIHFIELKKYDENFTTLLDRWVNFLKKAEKYEKNKMPPELAEIPSINKAIKVLENMSFDSEEREVYEARLKWLLDEEIAIKSAENRGFEKGQMVGIEQGIEQGIEKGIKQGEKLGLIKVAQELLDILDDETIVKKTGLSIDEVKSLRQRNI